MSLTFNLWFAFLFQLILSKDDDTSNINDVIYDGPNIVFEGNSFEIKCRMSAFDAPRWIKNDKVVEEIIDKKRIFIEDRLDVLNTRNLRLIVYNATPDDSGVYRCNSFSRSHHTIEIIGKRIKQTKIIEDKNKLNQLKVILNQEYSTVELICPRPAPIYWYKNNVRVYESDRIKLEDSKLIIYRAMRDDLGNYLCEGDSLIASGGSQLGQMMQLRAPIKVIPFPSEKIFVLHSRRHLECKFWGYPLGNVSWLIGNKKLTLHDQNYLGIQLNNNRYGHPNARLTIKNVTEKNENLYTCFVENEFSSDESSVLILVRANAITTNIPKDGTGRGIVLIENSFLVLSCNITDEEFQELRNLNINEPEFEWQKDGVNYDNFIAEDKNRVKIHKSNHSLTIWKTAISDVGDYQCKLKDTKLSAEIKVRAKPKPVNFQKYYKTNYKSANIIEGDKLELDCEVQLNYRRDATIQWLRYPESDRDSQIKNYTEVVSDSHIRVEGNSTRLTLTIDNVLPKDRAYYVCFTNNNIASVNYTILLRVKDKLGALWPFLGIVAEVIILCAIIFIYEKRRVKPDFDELDNEQNTETKGLSDRTGKSQDVRQRK